MTSNQRALDAMDKQRKRQAEANKSMDWRSSNNNRLEDFDSNFKMMRDIKKSQTKGKVHTASTPFVSSNNCAVTITQEGEDEWIPGLIKYYTGDCDKKEIEAYNRKVVASYNNRRRNSQQ